MGIVILLTFVVALLRMTVAWYDYTMWNKFKRWLLDPKVYPPEAIVQIDGMCKPHWYGTFLFGNPCRVCGIFKGTLKPLKE
jgi:hypothetical protein